VIGGGVRFCNPTAYLGKFRARDWGCEKFGVGFRKPHAILAATAPRSNGWICLHKMVYRGGCGSALDAECAAPSVTMSGSRSV
jgi:hypothetical protein